MKEYFWLTLLVIVASAVFMWLWRRGAFLRVSGYVRETQEELKKCTWPTWEELKGSTAVVIVSIGFLGAFTMAADFVIALIVRMMVS